MQTVELIFTVIGLVVTVASAIIAVAPAVDKTGVIGKIIWCLEHFSVFLAKFKNNGAANANQS